MTPVRKILEDESPKDFFRTRNLRLFLYGKEPVPFKSVPVNGSFKCDTGRRWVKISRFAAVCENEGRNAASQSIDDNEITYPHTWSLRQIIYHIRCAAIACKSSSVQESESPKDFFRTRKFKRAHGYGNEPVQFRFVPVNGVFVLPESHPTTHIKAGEHSAYLATEEADGELVVERVDPDALTFPEGWNRQQIEAWFNENPEELTRSWG